MSTQPSDVPLNPAAQSEGDPAPLLAEGEADAPLAEDPSLEAAADDVAIDAYGEPTGQAAAPSSPTAPSAPDARPLASGVLSDGSAGGDDDEVARLRAQVNALLNDPFDEWVERIQVGGVTASGFETTLSWRVTKPLRLVRTFQIRVQQLGLPGAIGHTARFVKRRLAGRTR